MVYIQTLIKKTISDYKRNLHQYTDKGLVWELTKLRIRSASIPYCIKKKKQLSAFKDNLEKERNLLQEKIDSNPSDINLDQFNTAKNELEQVEKHETRGFMFRSKIKWIEGGEKNTKFVVNLEKQNYCNKLITNLEVDGKLIKEQQNIAEAQKHFFQNLYSEKLNRSNENYKNSLKDFHKLSNSEKELCDQPLAEKEILNSLKQLHNGKTPGTVGLPPDFYKYIWIDIKSLLIKSIKYAIETGEMSIEQRSGTKKMNHYLTSPPKKKNCHKLKNWDTYR